VLPDIEGIQDDVPKPDLGKATFSTTRFFRSKPKAELQARANKARAAWPICQGNDLCARLRSGCGNSNVVREQRRLNGGRKSASALGTAGSIQIAKL